MKEIENYQAPKYRKHQYKEVSDGVYSVREKGETLYVTSLSFLQEPELGEGTPGGPVSQYPLEDLLDRFYCYVRDPYEEENREGERSYCEFAAETEEDIRNLRSVIGRHVYLKENSEGNLSLVIE